MMLSLGVTLGSRLGRALPPKPAPQVPISLSADNADVPATRDRNTLTVTRADYAGTYAIDPAALARGPVCLVPPTLPPAAGGAPLRARPGLWAYDPTLGGLVIQRRWLADGAVLQGESGLDLAFSADLEGFPILHAETAQQAAVQTMSYSAAATWPVSGTDAPEPGAAPEWVVTSDQRVVLDGLTTTSGTVTFTLTEPAAYAGTHVVDSAQLALGPVCVVRPAIGGAAAEGATLTATPGLWVSQSEQMTCHGEWRRNDAATGETGPTYVLGTAQGTSRLTYHETASDPSGTRMAVSDVIEVQAVSPTTWRRPVFRAGPTNGVGDSLVTADATGDLIVQTKVGTTSNPRAYFDVEPGKTYELETEIAFGDATRIVGRLSDATGANNALNVAVFDIAKAAGQTQLSRRDVFTPTAGRVAMHYIFIMGSTPLAGRILSATRVREVI